MPGFASSPVVDTKKEEGGISYREKDLEGHLASEGRSSGPTALLRPIYREPQESQSVALQPLGYAGGVASASAVAPSAFSPSASVSPPASDHDGDGSDARNIPKNPMIGTDFALRIAYQALTSKLTAQVAKEHPTR